MSDLNVLLVVYAFPPCGGVGVLRAASLARYLPAEGIRLDVLTTRNPSSVGMDLSLLDEIPPEVTIHRTITLDLPFSIKKRLKRLVTGAKPPTSQANGAVPAGKLNFLKRAIQDLLLPDPQVTWLPVLTRAARRIIRERKIDLVLITGAPYSNYLLAERLRKSYPYLPIVLDFRDEWISTCFEAAAFQFSRSERARSFAIEAEAAAVASATIVVAVTEGARREIRARYPHDPEDKYQLIPNGFDSTRIYRSASSPVIQSDRKIVVTYIGSIYASTEPTMLVQALQSLPLEVKSRLKLRFIGHIEEPRYREALLQLGDMVQLEGYLPQPAALAAMNEADYALLITHDRLNVSAKFYDYIGAGKPILGCVHPLGDVRRLIEELHAGWWADSRDTEAIRQLFMDVATGGNALLGSYRPDQKMIAQYERKVLAQRYASLLHSIAEHGLDALPGQSAETGE
jgi:glycosyltransferase involved in cell wall biosynthesis